MNEVAKLKQPEIRFESSAGRGQEIYDVLEAPNWAPWLRFTPEQFDGQAEIFPKGQLLICDESSHPLAALSSNRIQWDGNRQTIPSWDEVAGEDFTYADTYDPFGNTLCYMSMSIRPDARGSHLPDVLINASKELAKKERIEHIVGDFRPSDYGTYKAEKGDPGFRQYCESLREDGLPIDGWLRSLKRRDVDFLAIDNRAMVIPATLTEFEEYRNQYNPGQWREIKDAQTLAMKLKEHSPEIDLKKVDEVWECGQTGTWYANLEIGKAVYIESNCFGAIPI